MLRQSLAWLAAVVVCLAASDARAAESVALILKQGSATGTQIMGESTKPSQGRENTIECLSYEQSVVMPTGRRIYQPIKIVKKIDKSSPLLAKALVNNESLEGTFKFFRPNPTGDGTTEQYYTVVIKQARVASIKQIVADVTNPASSTMPPMEEVTFVFQTISWTYAGGIAFEDPSAANR